MKMPDYVKEVLEKELKKEVWIIEKSKLGLSKESYIAKTSYKKIFLKFDVNSSPLKRLAELKVTPPLISSGKYENRTYIIQEFIEGVSPSKTWFNQNITQVINLINTYHNDKTLFELLKSQSNLDFKANVSESLKFIEKELKDLHSFLDIHLEKELNILSTKSKTLTPTELQPIHADPNYKNFLITKDTVYLLDWDDIRLSDPIREIAPILWWYVDKEKWSSTLNELGFSISDEVMDRFYWWLSRQALTIAVFFAKRNNVSQTTHYLDEFSTALKMIR